ncbi:amino acid/amide ABC transporter ATP-binding protein 2, HAAT family [Salinihabitans flavidus]|uniref:Amino acid/amide ABC transporter ATP-binding protein 2, HAAT family n=1 Tax=Salinihabitans flavidus TaxID=569882 RepID=A0A1H8P7R5_9RHOB|nr:ABC transporter ATP-binding protein [Salinihabitans flavidus]SEO37990.1 amino acid/amide ABC transporter ATP-binding protein 2, HAAT family [Salinihabitans flavidus]
MLSIENIEVTYHHTVQALRGLSLEVPKGRIVTLLGTNGAGKTTTLKAASNLLRLENGEVGEGRIRFKGEDTRHIAPDMLVKKGLFHVREGRRIFAEMTVEDNLIAASYALDGRPGLKADFDKVYDFFPQLRERRKQIAGYLSGGEQQMLAFGRAMIAQPEMILMDEPSLGLAPKVVEEIFETIRRLNAEDGTTMLVVEQNAGVAFSVADYGYIMESGQIVMEGDVPTLRNDPDIQSFYLGVGGEGNVRQSFRDVKHYKRRKRWLS